MPRVFNPAILAEEPIFKAFREMSREHYTQSLLFGLAYSNRIMFRSAIAIRLEMGLTARMNSQTVRYLLLTYFTSLGKPEKPVITRVLERNDFYKVDSKRMSSMQLLNTLGLCEMGKTPKGNNTIKITHKGLIAITIIMRIIDETILSYPKHNTMSKQKPIDKSYSSLCQIDSSYNKVA